METNADTHLLQAQALGLGSGFPNPQAKPKPFQSCHQGSAFGGSAWLGFASFRAWGRALHITIHQVFKDVAVGNLQYVAEGGIVEGGWNMVPATYRPLLCDIQNGTFSFWWEDQMY